MASTATVGRVSVALTAETARYIKSLADARQQTNKNVSGMSKIFGKHAKTITNTIKVFGTVGTAATVAAGAIAAIGGAFLSVATKQAKANMEMQKYANMADMTVAEMERMDFITNQFGGSADHLSDKLKDIKDKAREFARDMSGGFEDLRNELGMSKDEMRVLSQEIVNMEGADGLQKIFDLLQAKGLTDSEMIQAVEALGSDLTWYIPMFKDGGKAINEIGDAYDKAVKTLSEGDLKKMAELSKKTDLVAKAFSRLIDISILEFFKPLDEFLGKVATKLGTFADNIDKLGLTEALKNFMVTGDIETIDDSTTRLEKVLEQDQKKFDEISSKLKDRTKLLEDARKAGDRALVARMSTSSKEMVKWTHDLAVLERKIRDTRDKLQLYRGSQVETSTIPDNIPIAGVYSNEVKTKPVKDPQNKDDRLKAQQALDKKLKEMTKKSLSDNLELVKYSNKLELEEFKKSYEKEFAGTKTYETALYNLKLSHRVKEQKAIFEEYSREYERKTALRDAEIESVRAHNAAVSKSYKDLRRHQADEIHQAEKSGKTTQELIEIKARHAKESTAKLQEYINSEKKLLEAEDAYALAAMKSRHEKEMSELKASYDERIETAAEFKERIRALEMKQSAERSTAVTPSQENADALLDKYGVVGGDFETRSAIILDQYKMEEELFRQHLENKRITEEEYNKLRIAAAQQLQADMLAQVQQSDLFYLQSTIGTFEQMNNAFAQIGEEGSAIAKGLFLAQKAVAIAQAVVATELAATKAMASETTTAGMLSAAGMIRLQGYAGVAAIAAEAVAGFKTGIDNVPHDGLAMLHKNERVLNDQTNMDLHKAMIQIDALATDDNGVGTMVNSDMYPNSYPTHQSVPNNFNESGTQGNIRIDAPIVVQGNVTDESWFAEQLVKQRNVIAASVKKVERERPRRK